MKTSKCESQFIVQCIEEGKRLDGRTLHVGRTLQLAFGQERGCCMVMLGNTRILAQVTCEITEPKPSRLTEGSLHVNFELSAMARDDIKHSRMSDELVESQCLLERCIRDSKCIDLESLCIIAGSKVWTLKVDIHALNDDGNLIECSSIAAISALAHFRRPDVTVIGTDVTIHSVDDREPVALNLHHMPININLALYGEGKYIVVDPIEIEQKIADGSFVVGVNSHQEICVQHYHGILMLKVDMIQKCLNIAIKRVQAITQIIKQALEDDAYKRKTNAPVGFVSMLNTGTILGSKQFMPEINLKEFVDDLPEVVEIDEAKDLPSVVEQTAVTHRIEPSKAKENALKILQEDQTAIFEGGKNKWGIESEEEEEEEEDSVNVELESTLNQSTSVKEESMSSEESSEEETVYMDSDQIDVKGSKSRGWYSKNPFA